MRKLYRMVESPGLVQGSMKARILLIAVLGLTLGPPGVPAQDTEAEIWIHRFLSALEGEWIGRAGTTPIGPRPYDISFMQTAPGIVVGSVDTGASIHHWKFFEEDGRLRIRFLSTFGGNREPIFLDVDEREDEGILFRAARPPLLSVRVSVSPEPLRIEVFHWNEPHVEIRLTRRPRQQGG